uniref:Membrane-bound lytic murein transglycosylase D (EC) n=1 Tax=uncultured Thiotrichaceae bacterium TaxID=298394 RepID=A0A6S6SXR5_9GAMM|nr:MAG: Membrane-bound lytic murein transglycosylase D precursor (EC [uncultured Thiotrichaceae bacterium]
MGQQSHLRFAVKAAATCALFTTTSHLHAQGGIFDPNIPNALPLSQVGQFHNQQPQNYQARQQPRYQQPAQPRHQYRQPARQPVSNNQTQFRQASYAQPRQQYPLAAPAGGSVWSRITQTYGLPDYSNNYRVNKFVRSYGSKASHMGTLFQRADPFMHMIIEEVNRRGMPAEIALLPFVESGFRLDVFSHASAAGLWQFIPSTGKIYGLKQTRGFDQRMDPFAATNAALNYLQKLHREFKGDWLKALAAYNCGENCVHRAVAKARRAGKSPSYWNLSLPKETMNYVPRLLAFRELLSKANHYGLRLPSTPNSAKIVQVSLNKSVNLRQAAVRAGLPANLLTRLNPNFRKGVTLPRLSNRITVPRKNINQLIQVLRTMPPA